MARFRIELDGGVSAREALDIRTEILAVGGTVAGVALDVPESGAGAAPSEMALVGVAPMGWLLEEWGPDAVVAGPHAAS